ncbi:hypothetical protein INR49_018170, partial [Caranx melampygus]
MSKECSKEKNGQTKWPVRFTCCSASVSTGGIVNVMPLLFSQISHNRTQILWFRRAVLGGLTTCTVLNIL